MAPSDLESVSRYLESRLDLWGWLLLTATLTVVVGLLLEYWHPISEFIAEIRRPMTVFRWGTLMELAGALLVVIGVACELGFTYMAYRVEGKLRANNHKIEQGLKDQASANELEAARLRNETVLLEQKLADRHITIEQRKAMLKILRPQSGAGVLIEYVTPSGTDAPEYALEIGGVFHDAGWKVTPSSGALITMNPPLRGFEVEVRDKGPSVKRRSSATKRALELLDARVFVKPGGPNPNIRSDIALVIYVGSK